MGNKKPNIFIIVLDTLRKDYSYPLRNILEKRGFISYNKCISPSPWTIPSHESLLTGLYPSFHDVHVSKYRKLPNIYYKNYNFSLHYIFKKMNYKTLLFSANTMVSPVFNLKGFEIFKDISIIPRLNLLNKNEEYKLLQFKNEIIDKKRKYTKYDIILKLIKSRQYRILFKKIIEKYYKKIYIKSLKIWKKYPMEKGISNLLKYIDYINKHSQPIFVFINLMEVHEPYQINEEGGLFSTLKGLVKDETIKIWRKNYPIFANYMFKKLEFFINNINDKIYNNSLIIITSDHGQLLGEKNRLGHGVFLDNELLFIPLFIKYPDDYNISLVENNGYISLVNIKNFILYIINNYGKNINDKILYNDYVVAESYGIPFNRKYFSNLEYKKIAFLDKHRIAFYHRNIKITYNLSDNIIEEIDPPYEDITDETKFIIKKYISDLHKIEKIRKIKRKKLN